MDLKDFDPDGPADDTRLFGLPHPVDEAAVAVIPVPWDATTSYRQGTAQAPDRIVEASGQLDLYDLQTREAWREGIAMVPLEPRVTQWSAQATEAVARARATEGANRTEAAHDADVAAQQLAAWLEEAVAHRLRRGQIPAVLGGDHSVPLGAMVAAAKAHPGLGILHVDAHLDLRVAYEGFVHSHASILHNVLERAPDVAQVVQVGIRDIGQREWATVCADARLTAITDPDIAEALASGTPWSTVIEQVLAPLPQDIWITFDIDGLDPALCPNTGTPVPGGLTWHHATTLLAAVARSGRRIIGFDLCEVGPGEWDAIVGARILYKLATWAITTRT